MTKPVRRIRAGQPPDVDDWAGMPIQMIEPPPKPSKRLGFFVTAFLAVSVLALIGAICIVAYRPSLITGALS